MESGCLPVPLNCLCHWVHPYLSTSCSLIEIITQSTSRMLSLSLSLIAGLWNQKKKERCRSNLDWMSVYVRLCECTCLFELSNESLWLYADIHLCILAFMCVSTCVQHGWMDVCAGQAYRTICKGCVPIFRLSARRQRDVEEKHFKLRLTLKQNLYVSLWASAYSFNPFYLKIRLYRGLNACLILWISTASVFCSIYIDFFLVRAYSLRS